MNIKIHSNQQNRNQKSLVDYLNLSREGKTSNSEIGTRRTARSLKAKLCTRHQQLAPLKMLKGKLHTHNSRFTSNFQGKNCSGEFPLDRDEKKKETLERMIFGPVEADRYCSVSQQYHSNQVNSRKNLERNNRK